MLRRSMLAGLLLAGVLGAVALGPASPAGAQEDRVYDSADECIQAKPVNVDPFAWSCYGVDGNWRARATERGGAFSETSPGPSFGAFLTFAIFWSLIPFVLALVMAGQRGESMGGAVLLTLVLGWIGLAVVYFGQRRARQVVEGLATRWLPRRALRQCRTRRPRPTAPRRSACGAWSACSRTSW